MRGPRALIVLLLAAATLSAAVTPADAQPAVFGAGEQPTAPAAGSVPPSADPFYRYSGAIPLEQIAPGKVLGTRTVTVHLLQFPLPLAATQLLYRTTGELGEPLATVTTVLSPPTPNPSPRLVSYQSAYDSLTPDCAPSYTIAGGPDRGLIPSAETAAIVPFLYQGYSVVVSDFEGFDAQFAAARLYGRATLDGIRAATHSPQTGLTPSTPVGMIGYSGGAIATNWALELAPTYAPDVNAHLIGAALGGLLVDPEKNLRYIEGSGLWSGVLPMALIGLARAFRINIDAYVSDYGRTVLAQLGSACILDALGRYPGLTFAQLVKPQYADPTTIPGFTEAANQIIMGTAGTPSVPLLVRQGTGGEFELTPGNKPGIGRGDGVMIVGDVRTLVNDYCSRGVSIDYQETQFSHIGEVVPFGVQALLWMGSRFNGDTPISSCGTVPAGNPVTPLPS